MYCYPESCENILSPEFQVRDEAEIYRLWENQCGKTFAVAGGRITVIFPGERNYYSGPDYKNCMLKHSGGTIITGDVEIHTDMKDWNRHGHSRHPEYANVVLHVIGRGIPGAIRVTDMYSAPTIILPVPQARYSDPCNNIIDETASDDLYDWVRQSAKIRWNDLCDGLSRTPEETVSRFFTMISIRGNEELVSKISRLFYQLISDKKITHVTAIRIMDEAGRSFAWRMGKRRPAGHPVNRIPLVSLLAGMFIKDPGSFIKTDFRKMKGFTGQLRQLGYSVPGTMFLKELMGNIIYPLQEILTEKDYYHHWGLMRVQPYAIVRQRLEEWRLTPDYLSFELQQGVLQIEKAYCRGRRCQFCPAVSQDQSAGMETDCMINENKNKLIN